jgi:hypothetical protein
MVVRSGRWGTAFEDTEVPAFGVPTILKAATGEPTGGPEAPGGRPVKMARFGRSLFHSPPIPYGASKVCKNKVNVVDVEIA